MLREHGVTLAIENHPERTPQEVLDKIEQGDGTLAATVDTGWWGTQGYDAVQAIEELGSHVRHVHLKDVRAVGEPHDTCRWGEGVVDIEGCVRALLAARLRRRADRRARAGGSRPERGVPVDARRAARVARMRVALVGCGNIAARYAKTIVAEPRLELGGATDVLPGRAAELVAEFGGRELRFARRPARRRRHRHRRQPDRPPGARGGLRPQPRGRQACPHGEARRTDVRRGAQPRGARRAARRQAQLGAGDAARRGAADGVEARSRRRDRNGTRGLRRGELGPDRDLAPVAAGPLRRRARRRRRHLSADDPDGDVRACPARRRLRHDARAGPHDPRRRVVQPGGARSQRRAASSSSRASSSG